jgi:AMP-polyphosphate phosphotransferase
VLETLDLSLKLGKQEYREAMERCGLELQALQRLAFENGLPVLILLEGWDAAGKGDCISHLVQNLDPRGFRVHVFRQPTEEEAFRPVLWRYWLDLPAAGALALYNFSWYNQLLDQRLGGELPLVTWEQELEEVNAFERQLADGGTLILKFWLHIGRKTQKGRLKAWESDEAQRWRVGKGSWDRHRQYDECVGRAEEMLARTHTHRAPWALVAAEDERFRRVRLLETVVAGMRDALAQRGVRAPVADEIRRAATAKPAKKAAVHPDPLKAPPIPATGSLLARVNLSLKLERPKYDEELKAAQARLRELHFRCYAHRRPVVLVFEGWDAAGKGGAIKRLTVNLDPRGYDVIAVAAPTREEKARHYLWRFWRDIPKDGHLTIFDRSWYGRVVVERIEGFCSAEDWRRAYQEINEFERQVAEHGAVICKFWLHISPEEQLARFRARERTPLKLHKITDEDWRNRARWPQYLEAVSDMLRQTSTSYAPWTIVEANDKLWARVKVIKTVVQAVEAALGDEGRGGEHSKHARKPKR